LPPRLFLSSLPLPTGARITTSVRLTRPVGDLPGRLSPFSLPNLFSHVPYGCESSPHTLSRRPGCYRSLALRAFFLPSSSIPTSQGRAVPPYRGTPRESPQAPSFSFDFWFSPFVCFYGPFPHHELSCTIQPTISRSLRLTFCLPFTFLDLWPSAEWSRLFIQSPTAKMFRPVPSSPFFSPLFSFLRPFCVWRVSFEPFQIIIDLLRSLPSLGVWFLYTMGRPPPPYCFHFFPLFFFFLPFQSAMHCSGSSSPTTEDGPLAAVSSRFPFCFAPAAFLFPFPVCALYFFSNFCAPCGPFSPPRGYYPSRLPFSGENAGLCANPPGPSPCFHFLLKMHNPTSSCLFSFSIFLLKRFSDCKPLPRLCGHHV